MTPAQNLQRVDRATLAAPVAGVVYEGVAARMHGQGDELRYPWGLERRDRAGVDSIAPQLGGKHFTFRHPPKLFRRGQEVVREGDLPGRVVGKVLSARVDGDGNVIAEILVTDPVAEKAIVDGTHELSLGYEARRDAAGLQQDIIVDHLALVQRGRCTGPGGTCALRVDDGARTDADGWGEVEPEAPDGRTDCGGTCHCGGACAKSSELKTFQTDEDGVQRPPCKIAANTVDITGPMTVENTHTDNRLNAAQRHALPGHMFGDPAHEGLPLENEGHVRDAMARFNQEQFSGPAAKKAAYHRIIARAHELGIDPSGFAKKYGNRLDEDHMDLQQKLDAALADAAAQKARADQAEKDRDAQKARADESDKAKDAAVLAQREAEKDAKAAGDRADAAESKVKDAEAGAQVKMDEAFNARVNARVEVLANANKILGATDKDGKAIDRSAVSDLDLMKSIAKHVDGDDAILESDGESEVKVAYRGALKRHSQAAGSRADALKTLQTMRTTGAANLKKTGADVEAAALAAMRRDSARRPQN